MHKLLTSVLLILPLSVSAQVSENYRGSWITEADGVTHVFLIVIRDGTISGIYCHDCEEIDNLAFIDDATFDNDASNSSAAGGLDFMLYHYPADKEPYREWVHAVRKGEDLQVSFLSENSSAAPVTMVLHRQAPDPALDSLPVNPGPPGNRERIPPGEPEMVTPEKVLGTWLWGAGPGKQIFMFRRHKDGIRGMVCGPCDRLDAMAPLEKISWSGTNFHFEIVHEDGGPAYAEHGPHSNVTDAVISKHEMLMSVVPSFEGPDFDPIEMTLLGPVR